VKRTPLQRKPVTRRALRRDPMDGELRDAIFTRAGGYCDLCRKRLPVDTWQCHHRLLRSRGGTDSLVNLIALHTNCHTWIHNHPTWADDNGFMVPTHHDPLVWPVHRWQLAWMAPGATWEIAPPHPDQLAAAS
jgi:hypothetical protein